jgi:membrane protein DedA with SNARE-associated domain
MEFVIGYIDKFQYVAIAFVLFIAGLGVPIPEDIPLIYGGVMSGQGQMNVWIHFAVSMIFILVGDVCLYTIGKRFARRQQLESAEGIASHTEGQSEAADQKPSRLEKLLTPERRAKVQDYFDRYGSWTVFFGRFVAGLRGAIFLTAGLTNFPLRRFILLDALAALISVPVWIALGYWFGSRWQEILETFKSYQGYVLAGVAVVVLVVWLWKKRASSGSEVDV